MDLWNKTTTTQIFDASYLFLYLAKNLWGCGDRHFNINW